MRNAYSKIVLNQLEFYLEPPKNSYVYFTNTMLFSLYQLLDGLVGQNGAGNCKFWSLSLEHFIKHKPLISEE